MSITVVFDPPLPSDNPAVFNQKAFTLLGNLNTWSTQANALATEVNQDEAALNAAVNAAATSATNAQNSANAASASATSAKNSANAASASATAAANSFDAFDDRYLGAKASDPTTDNDGNALLTGALYWNTTANEMRVWNGAFWQDAVEAVGADMVNMDHTAVMQALSLAKMAHDAIDAMRFGPWQQQGELLIRNRGVVNGCAITKSTTAARNLHIAAGRCFAGGNVFTVAQQDNAASVPPNTGGTAVMVSAYLYPHTDGQTYRLAVTAIGQPVPDNGIEIYRLTIPANNTGANDPNLTNVTLTDVRRIEANFPDLLDNPVSQSVSFARPMKGADWRLHVDVISATGAPCRADQIAVSNRATNGCTLWLGSAADDVRIRWQATRLHD